VEIQDRSLKNDWYQTWAMYKKTSPYVPGSWMCLIWDWGVDGEDNGIDRRRRVTGGGGFINWFMCRIWVVGYVGVILRAAGGVLALQLLRMVERALAWRFRVSTRVLQRLNVPRLLCDHNTIMTTISHLTVETGSDHTVAITWLALDDSIYFSFLLAFYCSPAHNHCLVN